MNNNVGFRDVQQQMFFQTNPLASPVASGRSHPTMSSQSPVRPPTCSKPVPLTGDQIAKQAVAKDLAIAGRNACQEAKGKIDSLNSFGNKVLTCLLLCCFVVPGLIFLAVQSEDQDEAIESFKQGEQLQSAAARLNQLEITPDTERNAKMLATFDSKIINFIFQRAKQDSVLYYSANKADSLQREDRLNQQSNTTRTDGVSLEAVESGASMVGLLGQFLLAVIS